MTSESNPPDLPGRDQPPIEEPSPVTDAIDDAKAAFNRAGFSAPSGMVALAGLILIGVDILFGLILEEWYIEWAVMLLAIAAVITFYGKGAYDRIGPAQDLLKLTGYLIAALGAFGLVYDLRYASSRLNDIPEILGALLTYGASVLAFLGARAIKT